MLLYRLLFRIAEDKSKFNLIFIFGGGKLTKNRGGRDLLTAANQGTGHNLQNMVQKKTWKSSESEAVQNGPQPCPHLSET